MLGFSSQQELVEESRPPSPPQFALSDAEAIQKFRDSNRFAPENSRPSTRDSASGTTGYKNIYQLTISLTKNIKV